MDITTGTIGNRAYPVWVSSISAKLKAISQATTILLGFAATFGNRVLSMESKHGFGVWLNPAYAAFSCVIKARLQE